MPAADDTLRLLTTPLRLTGDIRVDHLAALVSADALCRWTRARGRPAELLVGTVSGNQAAQHATERDLAKEGLDRATLGREAFVERVHRHETEVRAAMAAALEALAVDADIEQQATHAAAVSEAARVAFVRLFEEGRVKREERVVSSCPRCLTVVGDIDIEPGQAPADCHRIGLTLDREPGLLVIETTAPELLLGAVAVAVPAEHPAVGGTVTLPTVGRDVPVVAHLEPDTHPDSAEPRLVVPAHDAADLETARRLSLTPVAVFDVHGAVVGSGPLAGLGRYAARAAMVDLLLAEGDLLEPGPAPDAPTTEAVARCRLCGTVLVPALGRHWFLTMSDLEVAVADKVRNEEVTFSPASARDEFLAIAGTGADWCLSHQLWAGLPVPAGHCQDCGQLAVSAGHSERCNKCMGTLTPDDTVLDARFVAAVGVLVAAGWPADESGVAGLAGTSAVVVSRRGVGGWALPMAAVSLRLTGSVPFSRVVVHDVASESLPLAEVTALVESEGAAAVRVGLIAGHLTAAADAAHGLLTSAARPPGGSTDLQALADACDAAFEAGEPAAALAAVGAALAEGVARGSGPAPIDLLAPITGADLAVEQAVV